MVKALDSKIGVAVPETRLPREWLREAVASVEDAEPQRYVWVETPRGWRLIRKWRP